MNFFNDIGTILAEQSILFTATTESRTLLDLLPEERTIIEGACDSRQKEFATGRWLAHQLIKDLGVAPDAIIQGENREAIWPKGVCASITHTKGACCVIASHSNYFKSLGVDIEQISRRVSPQARAMIVNPDEISWINSQDPVSEDIYITIFSIKESIYKMLFPLVRSRISFSDISVLQISGHKFTCHINRNLEETIRQGRIFEGMVFKNQIWIITIAVFHG